MAVRALLRVVLLHDPTVLRQHVPVIASAPKISLGSSRGRSYGRFDWSWGPLAGLLMDGSLHFVDMHLVEFVLGARNHAGAQVARSPISPALEEVVPVAAVAKLH